MNDPRVFPLGRVTGTDPVQLARLIAKAETLAECHQLASALERGKADAGAVRFVLGQRMEDAWLQVEAFREGADFSKTGPAEADAASATRADGGGKERQVRHVGGASTSPLDEAPQPGRASSGASSSGVRDNGETPSSTLPPEGGTPLTYQMWLRAITSAYDEIMRALAPEPQSRKAFPKLKRVK